MHSRVRSSPLSVSLINCTYFSRILRRNKLERVSIDEFSFSLIDAITNFCVVDLKSTKKIVAGSDHLLIIPPHDA